MLFQSQPSPGSGSSMSLVINTQRPTNKDQTKTKQRGNNDTAGRVPPPLPTELLVLALTIVALRNLSRSSMVRHGVPSSANGQAATSSFHSPFSSFAKRRKSASVLVYMSGRRIEDTLGVLARSEAGCDWRSALSRADAL
jgi:hypothetical protein